MQERTGVSRKSQKLDCYMCGTVTARGWVGASWFFPAALVFRSISRLLVPQNGKEAVGMQCPLQVDYCLGIC